MGESANENIQIFLDTLERAKKLKQSDYNTAIYYDWKSMEKMAKAHRNVTGICDVIVSGDDSFLAARKLADQIPVENVLVLNFANSISQGGGVRLGARAQEEDLCRTSTLYQSLISEEAYPFYSYNRKKHFNEKGSDTAVYSPNVYIIKDEKYQDIAPVKVSVVTMAAPVNTHGVNAIKILDQRIYKLLCLAEKLNHKNLVLGAWGCGAFGNEPEDVAELFRNNLGKFDCFEHVVFAVRMVKGRDEKNYRVFKRVLEENEKEVKNETQKKGEHIMETFNFENFDFDKAAEEVISSIKKPNILLCGASGVGKSSLVNSIFMIDVATVGKHGVPETRGIHKYERDDLTINLFDSEGYEIGKVEEDGVYYQEILGYIDKLRKENLQDMDKHIHEAWYCISAGNKGFFDIDKKLINELKNRKVPVMILITQVDCIGENELRQLLEAIRSGVPDANIYTYSTEIEESDGEIYDKYVQKTEIIKWALDNLDDSLQMGILPMVRGCIKEKRNTIMKNCVLPSALKAMGVVAKRGSSEEQRLMEIQTKMTMNIINAFGIASEGMGMIPEMVGAKGLSGMGKTVISLLRSLLSTNIYTKKLIDGAFAAGTTALLGAGTTLIAEWYLLECVEKGGADKLPFNQYVNKENLQKAIEYVKDNKSEFGIGVEFAIDDIINKILSSFQKGSK